MSDFLFSSAREPEGRCARLIEASYREIGPVTTREYHGDWGTLAIGLNPHSGFGPIETADRIVAVVGGPWLDDGVAEEGDEKSSRKTAAIAGRIARGMFRPESDLSGPFAIVIVDKARKEARAYTDLLSFLPIFIGRRRDGIVLGTHVDRVAELAGRERDVDPVSVVDALVNGRVTNPHTYYHGVAQMTAGSVLTVRDGGEPEESPYWVPREEQGFRDLREAAEELREAFVSAVARIGEGADRAGLLLSGGADSRLVLATIPRSIAVTCFTFTDRVNRESRLASRVARTYGAAWKHGIRPLDYYARQIESGARLMGVQYQSNQCHTIGFAGPLRLADLPLVYGGMYSDTLLKGHCLDVECREFRGVKVGRSWVTKKPPRPAPTLPGGRGLFDEALLAEAAERAERHRERVREFRPNTAAEWSQLWPMTHNHDVTHYQGGRRLYRSYEPFLDSRIVRASGLVAQEWKLDKALFHAMAKPLLRKSAWIPHSDGYFPYFGRRPNVPATVVMRAVRKVSQTIRGTTFRQEGPWPIMEDVVRTDAMRDLVARCEPAFPGFRHLFRSDVTYDDLFGGAVGHPIQFLMLQALACLTPAKG